MPSRRRDGVHKIEAKRVSARPVSEASEGPATGVVRDLGESFPVSSHLTTDNGRLTTDEALIVSIDFLNYTGQHPMPSRTRKTTLDTQLNGYKIANSTVLARIGREELEQLMRGYGYNPYYIEGDEPETMHPLMAETLDKVVGDIRRIQSDARRQNDEGGRIKDERKAADASGSSFIPHPSSFKRPRWPMIVFNSPKGWTGPKVVDGVPVEEGRRNDV
jgi:hypothetical protein